MIKPLEQLRKLLVYLLYKTRTAAWLIFRHENPISRIYKLLVFRREKQEWVRTTDWKNRIRDAVASPDNSHIPRVENAGQIVDHLLIMHNGLRVGELSYGGEGPRNLMIANRGVHEPQEERAFQEILKVLPKGSAMLELGSFWAFYSMWFYREVGDARCFCVEPDPENILMGKKNFALNFGENPPRLNFQQAYVGALNGVANDGVNILNVDAMMANFKIDQLAVLHADTQGYEVDVLRGAEMALSGRKIDYIFISTHANEKHRICLALLRAHNYAILADVDLIETFSFDGLIVARRNELAGNGPFSLSRK